MTPLRILGAILILAGALGLAFGGFSYTKETHKAEIGPLKLTVQDKEQVNVPLWASLGAVVVGLVLVVAGGKRR